MSAGSTLALLVAIVAATGSVAAQTTAEPPALERYRHRVVFQPTRLANVHFPEVSVAYRQLVGPGQRWVAGGSLGAIVATGELREAFDATVIGFGVGAEARAYFRERPITRFEPYATAALELSRAYYRASVGSTPVAGTDFARITDVTAVSRRDEVNFGIGFEYASETGFVLDLRPALALMHLTAGALGDETAPVPSSASDIGQTGFVGDGRDRRGDWWLLPRLRIGIGWAW